MGTKESKVNFKVFTQRELEILNLVADGYQDNEIVKILHIRVGSVGRHESNVVKKVGGPDLSSAVMYALEKGLISITYA